MKKLVPKRSLHVVILSMLWSLLWSTLSLAVSLILSEGAQAQTQSLRLKILSPNLTTNTCLQGNISLSTRTYKNVSVQLAADTSDVKFYSDPNCSMETTSAIIRRLNSGQYFWLRSLNQGSKILRARSTGYRDGTLAISLIATASPTPTPVPSPTASPTPSVSPTPTASPSPSPSPSPTASPRPSPSASPTPTTSPTPTPPPGTGAATLFPASEVWYRDARSDSPDPRSPAAIASLNALGWGTGKFQIQVNGAFKVLKANQSTPRVPFIDSSAGQPDCDKISTVPLPAGGSLEGESGYTCSSGGDCHLIVLDTDSKLLYEIWSSSLVSGTLHGTCAIVWDTNKNYWPASDRTFQSKGRGDQCTSADAAGFPISALITSADQVADAIQSGRGDVGHAQRFILPNSTMRSRSFIHPATHAGAPSNSDTNAVPYGALLRLKSSFNVAALPNEAARVIARSLQRYGMYLADGGNIAMNLQDDSTTTHKWSEWGFSQTDLQSFKPSDFEMMPGGQPIALTYDCVRAQ